MAQLTLNVGLNTTEVDKGVQSLQAKFVPIQQTLQGLKINKDLTAQIKALTEYYKTFAGVVVKVNTATTKATLQNEKLALASEKLATQEKKTALTAAKINTELSKQALNAAKAQTSIEVTVNSVEKLQKEYADLLTTLKSLEKNYPKGTFDSIKSSAEGAYYEIKALNSEIGNNKPNEIQKKQIQNLTTNLNTYKTQVSSLQAETKGLHGTLQDIVGGFLKFQLSAMLVMKPLQLIQSALSSINETLVKTEDAVISLQRVLPSGSATDSEISGKLYQIAQDYGQSFDNVSQIAQNFARTGMSWADTIKATEAAVLALNVAELDATEASEGLISIITQFDMSTEQLTETVDKLNKAADQNPVTTEKLLKALQRTGAAAKNANISLNDTIGIITTLSKATNRSGENLGTAVNSLIQFSSKASSLDTFAKLGGNVETAVEKYRAGAGSILEIWEELSKVIKERQGDAESILGGDLFGDEEWAGLNAELKAELGESYADITDIYDTASTFRKNYFIALLNDMENVKKVSGEIADANGYSQDENQKYLDTYTAKQNKIKAQWEDIANDEQGLLGIKKDLLDLGSSLLNIIKWTGGLKTTLVAVGGIVAQLFGAKMLAGINSFFSTLSTGFKTLQGSAGWIGLILTAISAIDGAIRQGIETARENERQRIQQQNEAIAKTNESIDAQKKEVAQINEVASTVENLREILDDSSQSEEEKAKAQDKLLQIQNTLVESNNKYKDSLDLTNGSLKEQLGLIEQLTTEQLKQKANDFLTKNKAEIEVAKKVLDTSSVTSSDTILSGVANDRFRFREIINAAISKAGLKNAEITEDNTYGGYHQQWKDTVEGWNEGGLVGAIGGIFKHILWTNKEDWTGEAKAGISFSGTVEQQLEAISKLKSQIATDTTLGLSNEETIAFTRVLDNLYQQINSAEYKQSVLLAERAKATQDWLNGTISEAEYLKIVYGIEKEIVEEDKKWTNNIKDVTNTYDDLISKLEELRDLQKESTDWEDKKLAIMEAEQAIENARNQATIRRFNENTGNWEWQADEKAIAEAEQNLQQAQLDLQEKAYDNIIEQLENGDATNESILAILKEVAPLLGVDNNFVESVINAFKDKTGVDLNQPIIDKEKSFDNGGVANGLGYMVKATSKPESVNNPELTAKIMSPTSNAQFSRYVKDMGIMFANAEKYQQSPIITRYGNTDNSVNNSGQVIISDINVGADKKDNIMEILNLTQIVPN